MTDPKDSPVPDTARVLEALDWGLRSVPKRPVVLSEPDRSLAWDLLAQRRTGHRFDGAAGVGTLPLVLFGLPDKPTARAARRWLAADNQPMVATALGLQPFGAVGRFGELLTITATLHLPGASDLKPRVCVEPDQPVFDRIRAGRFLTVFAFDGELLGACEVDFSASPICLAFLHNEWDRIRGHTPDLPDAAAHWWGALIAAGIYDPHLSVADRLSVGWVKSYSREAHILANMLKELHGNGPLPKADSLPPAIAPLYEAMASSAGRPAPVIAAIRQLQQDDPKAIAAILAAIPALPAPTRGEEYWIREVARAAVLLRFLASDMTGCGRHLPCLEADGVIRPLEIEPGRFRESFPPQDYWPHKPRSLHINWRRYVAGWDTPVDSRPRAADLQRLPEVDDPDEAEASADALLDEAVEEKKWTIPPGATVELAFGPFMHVTVFEHGTDVGFVARTDDGDFTIFECEPARRHFRCDSLDNVPPERFDAVIAAIKLLVSAVIRDFWVIEHRESVFGHRRQASLGQDEARSKGDPAVVYLPRIQYTPKPRLHECASQLAHQERRAHQVRPHLRRADRASAYQLILARKFNFDVPAGYTFVKPHQRGVGQRDVIYRSRSAIRSLYEAVTAPEAESQPTAWFRFERDVRFVLERLGFRIQHIAASQRGDGSIDIYATAGDELHEENWIVHSKHCRGASKVPPRAARDLAEALAEYPLGTRGMLMTDGEFSPGAVSTAQEYRIRLVDGREMARVLAMP